MWGLWLLPGNVGRSECNCSDSQHDSSGITEEDKKDLVHWMAYRERRPPSPSPEDILQRMRKPAPRQTDRFVECKPAGRLLNS